MFYWILLSNSTARVITSYSIHYTKLSENDSKKNTGRTGKPGRPDRAGKKGAGKTGKAGKTGAVRVDKSGETAYDRLKKALEPYEKTLEKNPEDVAAWAGKGSVFLRHRMYKDSLKAYEKALVITSYSIHYTKLYEVQC